MSGRRRKRFNRGWWVWYVVVAIVIAWTAANTYILVDIWTN